MPFQTKQREDSLNASFNDFGDEVAVEGRGTR